MIRTRHLCSIAALFAASTLVGCKTTPSANHATQSYASSSTTPATVQPATNMGYRAMSVADFELLKKSVLFTDDDVRYLRMSRDVLKPNVSELLDVWYGFVGSNDHLLDAFKSPTTGEPNGEYLAAVRTRFEAWVLNTAEANFDQAWLNQQLEFGLRHHRLKKNHTDHADATDHIPFRYVVALNYPVTTTLRPFLARGGHSEADVQGMYEAWRKAVLMSTILWSQPYIKPRDF